MPWESCWKPEYRLWSSNLSLNWKASLRITWIQLSQRKNISFYISTACSLSGSVVFLMSLGEVLNKRAAQAETSPLSLFKTALVGITESIFFFFIKTRCLWLTGYTIWKASININRVNLRKKKLAYWNWLGMEAHRRGLSLKIIWMKLFCIWLFEKTPLIYPQLQTNSCQEIITVSARESESSFWVLRPR